VVTAIYSNKVSLKLVTVFYVLRTVTNVTVGNTNFSNILVNSLSLVTMAVIGYGYYVISVHELVSRASWMFVQSAILLSSWTGSSIANLGRLLWHKFYVNVCQNSSDSECGRTDGWTHVPVNILICDSCLRFMKIIYKSMETKSGSIRKSVV